MIPPSGAQIIEYCARPTASDGGSLIERLRRARRPPPAPRRTSSPMCDRSNSPARSTGPRDAPRGCPSTGSASASRANSTSLRAERASCRSRMRARRVAAIGARLGHRRDRRLVALSDATADGCRRPRCRGRSRDERALRLEGEQPAAPRRSRPSAPRRTRGRDGQVAADGHHEEVVDGLVDPGAGPGRTSTRWSRSGSTIRTSSPVSSRDLAQGRLLGGLARVGRALGQGPRHAVALPPALADDELGRPRRRPDDDAAGRGGDGLLRRATPAPRRSRLAAPAASSLSTCIEDAGLGRPLRTGRPGRSR